MLSAMKLNLFLLVLASAFFCSAANCNEACCPSPAKAGAKCAKAPEGGAACKIAWLDDFDKAVADAKESGKLVMVYFTGSDWCPYCVKFDNAVLKKAEFIKWADKNALMILCDFPQGNKPPKAVAERNAALSKKFGIRGFPTMVVLNPSKKSATTAGYYNGISPESFIKELETFKAFEPPSASSDSPKADASGAAK